MTVAAVSAFDPLIVPLVRKMTGLWHPLTNPDERARAPVSRGKRSDALLRNCAAYRRNLQTEHYEYVSPIIESVTGFSAEEMSGMSLEDLLARVHPDDNLRMIFEFEGIAEGGRAVVEYRFRHKDGEYRWLADHAEVLREPDGTCCHRVGVLRDVTDRKQMDEATANGRSGHWGLFEARRLNLRRSLAAVAGAISGRHRRAWCAVVAGLLVAMGIVLWVNFLPASWETPPPTGMADVAAPVEIEQAAMATAEEIHQILHALKEELAVVKKHAAELTQQLIHLKAQARRGQPMGAEAEAPAPAPRETSFLLGSGRPRGGVPDPMDGSAIGDASKPIPAERVPSASPQRPAPDPLQSR